MIGLLLTFLAGLIAAVIWTKEIVPERFGARYIVGFIVGAGLFLWGRSYLGWDINVPWIVAHSWEVAAGLAAIGFIARWANLEGLGRWVVPIFLIIGAVWGLNSLYESGDPNLQERAVEITFLSLIIIGAGWFLFFYSPNKAKKKKEEAAKKSGGGH